MTGIKTEDPAKADEVEINKAEADKVAEILEGETIAVLEMTVGLVAPGKTVAAVAEIQKPARKAVAISEEETTGEAAAEAEVSKATIAQRVGVVEGPEEIDVPNETNALAVAVVAPLISKIF